MKTCEVFLLLVFSASALSDGGGLLRSCKIKDIECLSKSTEQFLEKTCKGIPEADIRAIDPLVIPALEYTAPDIGGVSLHFKNINISGLKDQKISDFQMDKDKKSVVLKLNVDLNIVSDLDVKISGNSKTLSGTYKAKATTLATANYNYDLKNNDKGVRYFEVLPETITCSIVGKPEASLNDELVQALRKDEQIKEGIVKYEKKREDCKGKTICQIVQKAYETVIHNIRAAAKFLPAEDFFQDI
ncbi:PREDICTED: juvenile hormone-binding protein-like [Papilio xuthus]|uniref:Juvenile hormone-binding protein-like n=1 Tax=Papilio xuthus TaxID=66420 RepID=A0AAJ6ZIG6_PAPXU|nr:PREDICTED: juvenile hormone-binding protein-like [Papilio xuthus]